MINREKYNYIRSLPFFSAVGESVILDLLDNVEILHFRKNRHLCYQEDTANFAYYQINGLIKEEKVCSNGTIVIGNFTIDKWYGLEESILEIPFLHDVYTLQESTVLSISRYNLMKIIAIPELQELFHKETLKNYRIVDQVISTDSPDIKLAKYLLSRYSATDEREITITQEQLSQLLNFTRETINKHLKALEEIKAIQRSRGAIRIINAEKLKTLAR